MLALILRFSLLVILLSPGFHTADWTSGPHNGMTLYACVGDDVIFPWTYAWSTGDAFHDIQWFYQGPAQELIAIFTHGVFSPLPAFANRVQHVTNGGLQISHVTTADSGNYSVEITGVDAHQNIFILQTYLILEIADDLMTTDLQLHVTMNPAAVLDNSTNNFVPELHCGHFLYKQQPPFDVQWMTPSGSLHGSSHYKDGHFSLLLPPQVTGGNYTCRVSASNAGTCAARDIEASVAVDAVVTTLAIMQARIDAQAAKLDSQAAKVEAQAAKLDSQAAKLDSQAAKLDAQAAELAAVKERNRLAVSFHAGTLNPHDLKEGDHLVLTRVYTNQGNGYNDTTGVFTAPVGGIYCFTATTGPANKDEWAGVEIMLEQSSVGYSNARDGLGSERATAYAVVHLHVGQTVWLKAKDSADYFSRSYFSGFLLSIDG